MACPKYLRTDLNPTAQQGGVWTYMGYNTVSSTGPFNMSPVTPLVQIPAGGNFPNDNPLVDPSNASLGFYQFRYSISRAGCAPSIKFVTLQVQPKANAGVDFSQVICSDAAPFSLQTLFNTNDGVPYNQNGTITVSPSINIGTFPTYTLNPASVPAGVYTLTRTVEWPAASGFTRQCEDCVDSSVATLSIVPAAASGTPAFTPQLTVCSFATPLDMATTITGEASTGNWYLVTAAAGQPTYSFVNMTVNSNLFNNVTQNFATGTQLTNQSSALTVNLQTAQRGRVYRFRYITAEGTSCQAQTDVLIYPMDPPLSGTATNETICYHNLPTPSAFPIYSWLTGATSTGSWSIATNPARPNRVIQHWAQGVTSPFAVTRGSDDTFNFQSFRNTALTDGLTFGSRVEPGSAFDFTFTYTNAPPSGPSTGCTTATTTFTKRIVFTYNPGATDFTQNNPYQVNCTNQAFSLSDLVNYEENFGQWHVAPTQLAPTSIAIPSLVVGTNSPATLNPGDSLSSANVNFANVPNGTYVFLYRGGSRWDSAEPQCQRNTIVYVTKNCCAAVTAGITNNTGSTELNCTTSSISLTATGGVSYLWSNGATTPTITVTAPATYIVTVTGPDGCTGTASITITENTTPPNIVITPTPSTFTLECSVSEITLTASGATSYNWSNGLGTNPVIAVDTAGTYTVTGVGANGCSNVASFVVNGSAPCPCNGQRGIFLLRHDFATYINPGDGQITSFIVDGVQQVASPVNFNRLQNITQNYGNCKGCPPSGLGTLHNAAVTNALDSLAIPCFDFEIPTIGEIQGTSSNIPDGYSLCSSKYTKIKAPMCVNWSITVSNGVVPYSSSSGSSTVTWANVNGIVSVTALGAALGSDTFPNYTCSYFDGNNVVPIGSESIC